MSEPMALNVIMMGPPGAGKGTQAEHFARQRNLQKITLTREVLCLGSLARTRRAHHDHVQRHGLTHPSRPQAIRPWPRLSATSSNTSLFHEPVIVSHDELRLHLLHG